MNLDTSIASVGGVCLGSKEIVDHQRLSGVGYVFSASSPPYTCTAASQALKVISKESYRCEQVRKTASLLRYHLRDLTEFCIDGDDISPIILIRIKSHNSWIANDDYSSERKLYEHASELLASKHGILVSVSRHVKQEHRPTRPNLRVLVSSDHLDEVERVSLSIKSALNETLQTHFSRK